MIQAKLTGLVSVTTLLMISACGRMDHLGKAPSFTPNTETTEHVAMLMPACQCKPCLSAPWINPRFGADRHNPCWVTGVPFAKAIS